MTLQELIYRQKEFDRSHKSTFCWDSPITQDNLEILEFLLVALMGELGETSNIVKKVVRGDFSLEEKKADLAEELADLFIYLVKLSYQLEIDLEAACTEKISKNYDRFKRYEKGDSPS